MYNILDLVPEPTVEALEMSVDITPQLVASIVIALLIVAAVVIVAIKLIKKSQKSKDKAE